MLDDETAEFQICVTYPLCFAHEVSDLRSLPCHDFPGTIALARGLRDISTAAPTFYHAKKHIIYSKGYETYS